MCGRILYESYFHLIIVPGNKMAESQVVGQGCEVTGHLNMPKIT